MYVLDVEGSWYVYVQDDAGPHRDELDDRDGLGDLDCDAATMSRAATEFTHWPRPTRAPWVLATASTAASAATAIQRMVAGKVCVKACVLLTRRGPRQVTCETG